MDALSARLDDATAPPVLVVEGEIDLANADELRALLDRTLRDVPELTVDLGGVRFLGAAGVRVFLGAAARLNGTGPLRIVNGGRLAWVLALVGLDGLDTIEILDGEIVDGERPDENPS
jgi:anti-anti-sigma factor